MDLTLGIKLYRSFSIKGKGGLKRGKTSEEKYSEERGLAQGKTLKKYVYRGKWKKKKYYRGK